jgi:nucleotide-binding universal stress UspA family protein
MNKILVAYDGSEPANRALERAAELATAFKAELGVVSVAPWRQSPSQTDLWGDAEARATALRSASDWLSERGLSATLLSAAGDPGTSIEKVAEIGDFDTIVVGTRDLGPVDRSMHGSVSEFLATTARGTVVIAR